MPVLGALLKEGVELLGVPGLLDHGPLDKHHALLVLLDVQLVLQPVNQSVNQPVN